MVIAAAAKEVGADAAVVVAFRSECKGFATVGVWDCTLEAVIGLLEVADVWRALSLASAKIAYAWGTKLTFPDGDCITKLADTF